MFQLPKLGATAQTPFATPNADENTVSVDFPFTRIGADSYAAPTAYTGSDASRITVGGELNKLACNVAMGRSMGGVHWRSDNTRSLRLGEQIAIEILRKRSVEYAERPVSLTFRAFDGFMVRIANGEVRTF